MPKISVIMGVYNCKNYNSLEKSVKSIINQTYKNWEFIICNDGSTNNTLQMLSYIAALDKRIKIISYKDNRGLASALNYCLQFASGEFIARQDDDEDVSTPDRFEKQLKFLIQNKEYDFVGSNCTVFDNNGIYGKLKVPEKVNKENFLWNSPFAHPTVIFTKKSLQYVKGYRIAEETKRCEDYDLFMRMYAKGLKGYNIQEDLYSYKSIIDKNKKYRPMKDRIDEAIVRYKGFKAMGILLKGIPFIVKPILIGLISVKLFAFIKKSTYK